MSSKRAQLLLGIINSPCFDNILVPSSLFSAPRSFVGQFVYVKDVVDRNEQSMTANSYASILSSSSLPSAVSR